MFLLMRILLSAFYLEESPADRLHSLWSQQLLMRTIRLRNFNLCCGGSQTPGFPRTLDQLITQTYDARASSAFVLAIILFHTSQNI